MINTNNYSQNRGSEVINQLTDYSYNVNMYEEIIHYYILRNTQFFHRIYTIVVEKVLISVDKWLIKCIWEK